MARQKRIALINDITGFGRCSVTAQLPLISAMRVQACPLPTAILSVHTGFPNHYLDDYTDRMRPYMENWAANALEFDAILTGFLGSERQIEVVLECIARFKQRTTQLVVDPVMGDNGSLYSSYTPALCAKMRQLLPQADVVTPNLTEACQLLGADYPTGGLVTEDELARMAAAIASMGPRTVIITGLHAGENVRTYLYTDGCGRSCRGGTACGRLYWALPHLCGGTGSAVESWASIRGVYGRAYGVVGHSKKISCRIAAAFLISVYDRRIL